MQQRLSWQFLPFASQLNASLLCRDGTRGSARLVCTPPGCILHTQRVHGDTTGQPGHCGDASLPEGLVAEERKKRDKWLLLGVKGALEPR